MAKTFPYLRWWSYPITVRWLSSCRVTYPPTLFSSSFPISYLLQQQVDSPSLIHDVLTFPYFSPRYIRFFRSTLIPSRISLRYTNSPYFSGPTVNSGHHYQPIHRHGIQMFSQSRLQAVFQVYVMSQFVSIFFFFEHVSTCWLAHSLTQMVHISETHQVMIIDFSAYGRHTWCSHLSDFWYGFLIEEFFWISIAYYHMAVELSAYVWWIVCSRNRADYK